MSLIEKIIFILALHILVPAIVAWLFLKIKKHNDFISGYLYSFLATFVMISVLEGLGNSIVASFITRTDIKSEDYFVYVLRICSLYILAGLGGAPFIAKAYEAIYGHKLEIEKINNDIAAIAEQSKTITEIVVKDIPKKSEKIKQLLTLVDSNANGISAKEIPEEFSELLAEVLSLSAIKSKFDGGQGRVVFHLTQLGKDIISSES